MCLVSALQAESLEWRTSASASLRDPELPSDATSTLASVTERWRSRAMGRPMRVGLIKWAMGAWRGQPGLSRRRATGSASGLLEQMASGSRGAAAEAARARGVGPRRGR